MCRPTLSLSGPWPAALACFAVEVDEGAEAVGFAADDGDHQGQAENAGAVRRMRAFRRRRARWGAFPARGVERLPVQ